MTQVAVGAGMLAVERPCVIGLFVLSTCTVFVPPVPASTKKFPDHRPVVVSVVYSVGPVPHWIIVPPLSRKLFIAGPKALNTDGKPVSCSGIRNTLFIESRLISVAGFVVDVSVSV